MVNTNVNNLYLICNLNNHDESDVDVQLILTHFEAATAVMEAKMAVLVTLPPKAPPSRLT